MIDLPNIGTTRVVGLGFRARSGKDTVAKYMHAILPEDSKVYHFSDALKAHVRVLGLMGKKDAALLQMVGTDIYRRADPDIWVRCLVHQIAEEQPKIAIVSDMRFANELEWVRQHGLAVRIVRIDNGAEYVSPDRPADHPSEIALLGASFDQVHFAPTGDFRHLRSIAEEIVNAICLRET